MESFVLCNQTCLYFSLGFPFGLLQAEILPVILFIYLFLFFCLFAFSRAAPSAYGGSQARGQMGAVATGLHHSHSNSRSELHLHHTYTTSAPTPQLMATPDPQPTE